MDFEIPDGYRNNSHGNKPTYLSPCHLTKASSIRRHVRFASNNGLTPDIAACLFRARSRHQNFHIHSCVSTMAMLCDVASLISMMNDAAARSNFTSTNALATLSAAGRFGFDRVTVLHNIDPSLG